MPNTPAPSLAPTGFWNILRELGPGIIISASIVGSGELIVTPKLGASVGFTMLWFIIFGCVVKVYIQLAFGRYAVSTGTTTLSALDLMPGPRLRVSWVLWFWVAMFVAMIFQVAGILGGIATILGLTGETVPKPVLVIGVALATAIPLAVGRYRIVERVSVAMVVMFTFCTLGAVVALQFTPFAVAPGDLVEGLSFGLPPNFTVAFAAFGIIGMGASELIYYPYWCLEKGYAARVGHHDGSAGWLMRALGWIRVMRIDAWTACGIYTVATVAFYILGAAVLHAKGLNVEDADMIATLSQMYRETFGEWSLWLFLIGAICVLFSTLFVATASNARMLTDTLRVFGWKALEEPKARERMTRIGCVLLPAAFVVIFLLWEAPVTLVFVGAVAQGLMLPFLAVAAVYLEKKKIDPGVRAIGFEPLWLYLAAGSLVLVGGYQAVSTLIRAVG